jgi:hypothetical protein
MLDARVREPDGVAGEVVAEEIKSLLDAPDAGLIGMRAPLQACK